jgi:DNA-binding CsgD family transcriptional regulator/peroxiredoxin
MRDGVDTATRPGSIPLTEREREVAGLVSMGRTNGEIAEALVITFATAKWHVSQVLSKLEVERREDVGPRLEALRTSGHRERRWTNWNALPFLKGLGLAKGLGVAAAVIPVAGVAVAGMLILRADGGGGMAGSDASPSGDVSSYPLAASTVGPPTAVPPRPAGIIRPAPQAQTCDWQAGQLNFKAGPLDHSGCDFTGVDFGAAMLNGANLSNATLTGATFRGASLYDADLTGADLRGTWIIEAVMGFTDFDDADLTGAHFTNSIVAGTWAGAICPDGGAPRGLHGSCVETPGMENLPTTRSTSAARSLMGQPAPTFSLADARDVAKSHQLSDYEGKTVVLWWFANWCRRCPSEVSEIQRLAAAYPDVAFLAMSLDEAPADALAFATANGLSIPIAMDSRLSASAAYEIIAAPTAVVLRPDHQVSGFALFLPWTEDSVEDLLP